MSIDIEELKKRLRKVIPWKCADNEIANEAVSAIESLQRENAALKHDLERSIATSTSLATELEEAREVRAAAENLIKVKGRHHTEIAYQRLISAIDAVRQQERDKRHGR